MIESGFVDSAPDYHLKLKKPYARAFVFSVMGLSMNSL